MYYSINYINPVVLGLELVNVTELFGENNTEDSSSISSGSPNSLCNLRNFSIVDCYIIVYKVNTMQLLY